MSGILKQSMQSERLSVWRQRNVNIYGCSRRVVPYVDLGVIWMRLYVFDPLIINICSLRIELIYNDSSFIS